MTSLLTPADAAEILGLNEQTIRRRIASGEIPAVNVGGARRPSWRIDPRVLDAYIASRPGAGDEVRDALNDL